MAAKVKTFQLGPNIAKDMSQDAKLPVEDFNWLNSNGSDDPRGLCVPTETMLAFLKVYIQVISRLLAAKKTQEKPVTFNVTERRLTDAGEAEDTWVAAMVCTPMAEDANGRYDLQLVWNPEQVPEDSDVMDIYEPEVHEAALKIGKEECGIVKVKDDAFRDCMGYVIRKLLRDFPRYKLAKSKEQAIDIGYRINSTDFEDLLSVRAELGEDGYCILTTSLSDEVLRYLKTE